MEISGGVAPSPTEATALNFAQIVPRIFPFTAGRHRSSAVCTDSIEMLFACLSIRVDIGLCCTVKKKKMETFDANLVTVNFGLGGCGLYPSIS